MLIELENKLKKIQTELDKTIRDILIYTPTVNTNSLKMSSRNMTYGLEVLKHSTEYQKEFEDKYYVSGFKDIREKVFDIKR